MATRFMRIDLSDEARDFRPIALEPGVPLLDRSNANAKILFRWLGGMVAEPVWEGDSVNFYVRDDHGGRLEEAVCQPATREDLDKLLGDDLAKLKDRIEKAKPDTPTERALKKMIRRSFQGLTEDPNRTDLDSYFFRYRDAGGRWRLVWSWGYQRVDQEPAPAVVCTDPECNLLFVRRPGQSPKCPSCEAALATRPKRKSHWKRTALVGLLLFLLGAGLVYWYLHPRRLIATPQKHDGPVGSRVQFKIEKAGWIPFWKEDVTGQTVGVVLDPAVARFDQMATAATLVGPGETLVRFHLGDLATDVALIAGTASNPDKILIEPASVALGIGTTARLKLTGEYHDGTKVDLTDAAEWTARNDGIVYAYEGLLEGLAEGNTTVTARYRANRESEYLDAVATVSVADVKFKSLELAIDPLPVGVGRASALRIDAVSEDDKRYSLLESSLLSTQVVPRYLATVEGRHLKGQHAGSGKLAATFNDHLTAGTQFNVVFGPGLDKLVVTPEKLNMVVGEIADLSIVSPSLAPVHVASGDSAVVEVTKENRLIARSEGNVEVEVTQGNQRRAVDVAVTAAEFASIAVDPARVVVPVDDTVRARVVARIAGEKALRNVEIAPDLLVCRQRPSPQYADFEAESMALHGVAPTSPSSPQGLAFRFGQHQASAPVEVVVAPLRLALTPPGPVDLPHGQQMRLQGWATYSGGRRVQVVAGRLDFQSKSPAKAKPGLELRGDKVAAVEPDAGPLEVYASYFGRKSKPVVFRSVEADPSVRLRLDVDRSIRLAGETGRVVLSATSPKGDVELVPEMAKFTSSAAEVLKIGEKNGAFRATAPGKATVTGSHGAAKEPASLPLAVYDPANARLVFDPASVKVAVDEMAELPLYLEVDDGGEKKRAELSGPGVGYTVAQPQAIRWSPPTLVGASPADPFELGASYYPVLSSIATARVEVVDAAKPENLRIVPSEISLAPGQSVPLRLQQQLPGQPDRWTEVRPDAAAWTVPPELIWTPATEGLRPAVTAAEAGTGKFELKAEYAGKEALALVTMKQQGPDPNDPDTEVWLRREPPGVYLPVGAQQRYSIVVKKGDAAEPAANVKWPDGFENQYVRWQAPVLTAKRAGYQQWLRAEVDGRAVLFHTTTYQPGRFERPPLREDQPVAVRIIPYDLDQPVPGQSVRFAVGIQFDDFRVEAEYPDGFTELVTKKATLRTSKPPQSGPLSASHGRLIGVRAGTDTVTAEFEGVRSRQPLDVEVTAELELDEIRITPAPITMRPGERVAMNVVGYHGGKSVGIITPLVGIQWESSNPQVAGVDGSSVTGLTVGQSSVSARFRGLASRPAPVSVVDSIAGALEIDPGAIRIRVGQGVRIGTDLSVVRGEMDVSGQCTVTPALPGVVRYVPETHSLVGVSPGASAVAFTYGDKLTNLIVEVLPALALGDDVEVVIEPSSGNLAPGQALDLRVFVVSPAGHRIDRTDSAAFTSSDPAAVTFLANRACALAPGTAGITAQLPDTDKTGQAYLVVGDEQITQLIVEPSRLAMSTGDLARLRVLGRAPCGTHEMFPQADLKLSPGGANPEAIQITGAHDVDAVQPGQASVAVNWRNLPAVQVPVSVTDDPLTDLRIEPASAVIHPGQPLVYQVTGIQRGERRVLGRGDGVQLFVSKPDVARVANKELAVLGNKPGRTAVFARVGSQQAEAGLDVVPGSGPVGGDVLVEGPGQVHVHGPGGGYYGSREGWRHGSWGGWSGWGGPRQWPVYDEHLVNHDVYIPPAAAVDRLRFIPDLLHLSPNSPPTAVRVVEVLADGSQGRDVTDDPQLEFTQPGKVVTVLKTETGPLLRPIGQGQVTIGARLDTLTADPLLVSVGDVAAGLARLVVAPNPLTLWAGETGTFGSVMLDPGGGLPLRAIDHTATPAEGQNVVASAGGKMIRGLSNGTARVVITAVDPTGIYGGRLSTTATVHVATADTLRIEPSRISLRVEETTPQLSVFAERPDGVAYRVPATLESMDENVLAPDPQRPGRFLAKAFGGTQIRAVYRGCDALADVTVTGKRFVQVNTTLDAGGDDFSVSIEVLADESEGPLEYRVYAAGQTPPESWVAAAKAPFGEAWQASLRSPRMKQGPSSTLYQLMIEARDPSGGPVQQYPLTFRLRPQLERTDIR